MINEIDKNVVKLVEILNKIDFSTIKSCEGHTGSDFHCCYPWVAFHDNSRIDYLKRIITEYNKNHPREEFWEIVFQKTVQSKKIVYILKPKENYKNIYFLQKQIMNLVKYLEKISVRSC